jgi:uncharacterized SAM-binding protein YcdF (DUF218 family)
MKKIFFILVILLFINLGNFLDLTTEPKKSDIIIVLGGGKDTRIKKGLELYKENFSNSNQIVIPHKNFTNAVLSKGYLENFIKKYEINESMIMYLERLPNTMEELIEIKKYLKQNDFKSVLFVTHPTHTLRIKLLANLLEDYEKEDIKINFASADHTKVWSSQYYFLELESIKLVFSEYIKIVYNLIKYTIFL